MEYDTLVLSGGSINSISIIGGLQYVKDNNMMENINTYIGTSAGAIICYLLIIGYTPVEIVVYLCINHHLFEKLKCFDILNAVRGDGATTFMYISDQLEKMTIDKIGRLLTLKDIETIFNKKLICVTYNITKASVEYLSSETNPELPCLIALRMSANLPLIFEHFKYENSFYIDGGIVNNFAVDIGEKYGKKVLGICLGVNNMNSPQDNPSDNILEYIYTLLLVPMVQSMKYKIKSKSDTTTVVELRCSGNIKMFNFDINSKTKLEMFSLGYEDTKNVFNKQSPELADSVDASLKKEASSAADPAP